MQTHRDVLKSIVSEISTDYFRGSFNQQLNAISMVKNLLSIEVWQPRFTQCVNEFNALQHQANIDYDTDVYVMETFMKIAVFAWCKMIPNGDAALLCNKTNAILMAGQLDLTKNRTFLGMNI